MPQLDTKQFYLDTTFDAKAAGSDFGEGDIIIEGWASDGTPDRYGDIITPGAFDAAIEQFMENPILLYNHDIDRPLGRVLELEQKDAGLWMKALVAAPTPGSWAEPVVDLVRRGITKALSVRGKMSRPFGRDAKSGQALVTGVDLAEISITPLGVNPNTIFGVVSKAFRDDTAAEKERQDEAVETYFEARFAEVEEAYAKLEETAGDGAPAPLL